MSKNLQIRNVPEDVHRRLKVRAAQEGVSLSELLLREAIRLSAMPTPEEMAQRLSALGPVSGDVDSVALIRELRGPMGSDG